MSNIFRIKKIQADYLTPVSCFLRIQGSNKIILESIPQDKSNARYSFIAYNPSSIFTLDNQELVHFQKTPELYQVNSAKTTTDPLFDLEQYLNPTTKFEDGEISQLPFAGGLIGYCSYDLIRYYENIGESLPDEIQIPDFVFGAYDSFLIFDHQKDEVIIVEANIYSNRSATQLDQAIEEIFNQLQKINPDEFTFAKIEDIDVKSNQTPQEFKNTVSKSIDFIKNGDLFQVVPSQRFSGSFKYKPFDYYRNMRLKNPSPYLYYFDFDFFNDPKENFQVIGASPETLVRVQDSIVSTNPIAGTRPRGKDEIEDLELEKDLLQDEKELAEHTMLVDLGRNDLGKVSEIGSVEVPIYKQIAKYRFVMHIISIVEGKLLKDKTAFDALKATLPAGTVSGAPKIRAMERINQFEKVKRNLYAGAVGYFSINGNCDFAIAIRTAVIKNQTIYAQAGAGIVYDSDPEKEYQESVNKTKSVIKG